MDWNDLNNELADLADSFFDHEMPKLALKDNSFAEDFQAFFRAQVEPEQAVVDAINAVIENQPLPDLTPAQRRLVWVRIHYAAEFAYALTNAPSAIIPDPPANRRLLLTWLLVHVWNYSGFRTVNASIEVLFNVSSNLGPREMSKN